MFQVLAPLNNPTYIIWGGPEAKSWEGPLDETEIYYNLVIIKSCEWVKVAQSCLTLCDPMDCSLPVSSVYGIFQARVLDWVVISFSRGSSQPRDQTQVSCIAVGFFTVWTTREAKFSESHLFPVTGCCLFEYVFSTLCLKGNISYYQTMSFQFVRLIFLQNDC